VNGPLSLLECVDQAVRSSLELKIERQQATSVLEEVAIAEAEFDPAITGQASAASHRSPRSSSELEGAMQPESKAQNVQIGAAKKFDTGAVATVQSAALDRSETNSSFSTLNPEYNASLRLNVRQPLLQGGGRAVNKAPIRLAEVRVDRSNIRVRQRLLDVLLESEGAYWLLAASLQAERIRENSLRLAELIVEETRARRDANVARDVDVLEARASQAEKQEALLRARKESADAKDRLFRVMGILQTQEPGDLRVASLPVVSAYRADPKASFRKALANAPLALLNRNIIREREIQLLQARRNRLPSLDLSLNAGLLGRDTSQSRANEALYRRDGYFWEVMLGLRIPWGLRRERALLRQAEFSVDEEKLAQRISELGLYTDIRNACREIGLAQNRLGVTRLSVELNQQRFEEQRLKRREGEATLREVLEAQEDMEEAELRQLESRLTLVQAITALESFEATLPQRHGIVLTNVLEAAP